MSKDYAAEALKHKSTVASGTNYAAQALGLKGSKPHESLFGKVKRNVMTPVGHILSAADMPRAFVGSTFKEASDLIKGGHGDPSKYGGGKASWSDLWQQAVHHEGFGDYVNIGNKWADRAIGLLGDVATDPFTIVGAVGGGSLGHGANDLAKLATKGVSRDITGETVGRYSRLGTKGLTDAEKAAAVEHGARIGPRVHGFGIVKNPEQAARAAEAGIGHSGVVLKPGLVTDTLSNVKAVVSNRVRGGKMADALRVVDRVNVGALRKVIRNPASTGEEILLAHKIIESAAGHAAVRAGFTGHAMGSIEEALKTAGAGRNKAGRAALLPDIAKALGGDLEAVTRLADQGVNTQILDGLKADIVQRGAAHGVTTETVEKAFKRAASEVDKNGGERALKGAVGSLGNHVADSVMAKDLIASGAPLPYVKGLVDKAPTLAEQLDRHVGALHEQIKARARIGMQHADDVVASTLEHGGATLDTNTGRLLEPMGFGGRDRGHLVPIDGFTKVIPRAEFTADSIRSYIAEHAQELVRDKAHLGTWIDPKTGEVHLDLAMRVGDRRKALAMARQHGSGQKAIFDMTTGKDVPLLHRNADGTVRLWRGESLDAKGKPLGEAGAGSWFSSDRDMAKMFAGKRGAKGRIMYVDVPESVARASHVREGINAAEHKLGKHWASAAKVEKTQTARSAAASVDLPNIDRSVREAVKAAAPGGEAAMADAAVKASMVHPVVKQAFEDSLKEGMTQVMPDGIQRFGHELSGFLDGYGAPEWAIKGLKGTAKFGGAGGSSRFLKFYDESMRMWKDYLLLTPGKGVRHVMAGVFGLSLGNFTEFKYTRGLLQSMKEGTEDSLGKFDQDLIRNFRDRVETHTMMGDANNEVESLLGFQSTQGKVMNAAKYLPNKNWRAQAKMIDPMRFAVFADAVKKGASFGEAADKVRQLMFTPSNMSRKEASWAKRVVPFYSFFRTQFPTHLQQMLEQPGKYVNVMNASKNLLGGADPGSVPDYATEGGKVFGGLREPNGGNPVMLAPDLPFMRMDSFLKGATGETMSQLTPALGLLNTLQNNVDGYGHHFNKFGKDKSVENPYPVVGKLGLKGLTPKQISLLEQIAPLLGQTERVFPTQEKHKKARLANIIKAVSGFQASAPSPR